MSLARSRVIGTLDFNRVAEGLSRPGIDPRTWVSLAFVEKVVVDPEHGPIVDVTLLPGGVRETAHLGSEYAGDGFGAYWPLREGDLVLVEAADGDNDAGVVVSKRLHSPSDPPPREAVDHPDDVVVHVRPGQTLRLVVEGGGNVVLKVEDGKVQLGGEEGLQPAVLGDDLESRLSTLEQAYNTHTHVGTVGGPPVFAPLLPPSNPVVPTNILAGSVELK